MPFAAEVSDGTAIPFPFFHKHYVRGLHLILLFSLACRFADVQIIEIGHEPFCLQGVGQVLLISDLLVVAQLRHDRLEPFLVRQEEEEARKVLLAAALHRLFWRQFSSAVFSAGLIATSDSTVTRSLY